MRVGRATVRRTFGTAAVLALLPAAPATATGPAIYGGRTAQSAPIALRVGADGRRLSQLLVHVDMPCDDGTETTWSGAASFASFKPPTIADGKNVFSPARVSGKGAIRVTGEASIDFTDGGSGIVRQKLTGSIRGHIAHGTYSASTDVVDANGPS